MSTDNKKKDGWDIAQIIIQAIAYIAIPVVILCIGSTIDSSIQDRAIKTQYIEIANEILRDKPTKESNSLREWAIQVLDTYSEIKLTEEALKTLRTQPISGKFITDDLGNAIMDDEGNYLIDGQE